MPEKFCVMNEESEKEDVQCHPLFCQLYSLAKTISAFH